VPPEADEAFLAHWRRAARGGAALHRAVRDDVLLRFVSVGQAALTGLPFPCHGGAYELVHTDGDLDGPGGVIAIEAFELGPADDERFLAAWHPRRDFLATQRGHLGTRLHRSTGPAAFRFVVLARWSSPLMVFRADRRPQSAPPPFRSHAAIYHVVRE
jgi:hypothetical protein